MSSVAAESVPPSKPASSFGGAGLVTKVFLLHSQCAGPSERLGSALTNPLGATDDLSVEVPLVPAPFHASSSPFRHILTFAVARPVASMGECYAAPARPPSRTRGSSPASKDQRSSPRRSPGGRCLRRCCSGKELSSCVRQPNLAMFSASRLQSNVYAALAQSRSYNDGRDARAGTSVAALHFQRANGVRR